MRIARRAFTVALIGAGMLAGSLAFSGSPALGFLLHPYLSHITEANSSPLREPWGVTFEAGGNLFAVDTGFGAFDLFSSTDAFTSQSVVADPREARSVAVSDATGYVKVGEY
jgi:hypothetical protein